MLFAVDTLHFIELALDANCIAVFHNIGEEFVDIHLEVLGLEVTVQEHSTDIKLLVEHLTIRTIALVNMSEIVEIRIIIVVTVFLVGLCQCFNFVLDKQIQITASKVIPIDVGLVVIVIENIIEIG